MREAWAEIRLSLQFLTRIPVRSEGIYTDARMQSAARWYPLIGVIVGCCAAFVLALANAVWPMPVAVVLTLVASIALTGALHEDGLADAADGFGGGQTRERVLEIMRDSRLGTYGSVALMLILALQGTSLMSMTLIIGMAALLAAHAVSRLVILEMVRRLSYARPSDPKGFTLPQISKRGLWLARGTALAATLPLLAIAPINALIGLGLVFAAFQLCAWYIPHRLQGYTGDTLGMSQQLSFTAMLLGAAM